MFLWFTDFGNLKAFWYNEDHNFSRIETLRISGSIQYLIMKRKRKISMSYVITCFLRCRTGLCNKLRRAFRWDWLWAQNMRATSGTAGLQHAPVFLQGRLRSFLEPSLTSVFHTSSTAVGNYRVKFIFNFFFVEISNNILITQHHFRLTFRDFK